MLESKTSALIPFLGNFDRNNSSEMNPDQFMNYLRTNVTIEDLLADRGAQAVLARILKSNFTRSQDEIDALRSRGNTIVKNPYPVIRLDREDNGASWMYETFMLKDRRFIYYFPGWDYDGVPPYLRPEDVVGSGTFGQVFTSDAIRRAMEELLITREQFNYLDYVQDPRITQYATYEEYPFAKPINRVPVSGGEAERYNHNTSQWEVNGDGVYFPSWSDRVRQILLSPRELFGSLRGKKLGSIPELTD